jgi:hypothetical protein
LSAIHEELDIMPENVNHIIIIIEKMHHRNKKQTRGPQNEERRLFWVTIAT